MTTAEYVLTETMTGATGTAVDRKRTAFALRLARQEGPATYAIVLAHALAVRAEWRTWKTLRQREWQAKVSRRPARGRHHDSWSIRERYVRAANS